MSRKPGGDPAAADVDRLDVLTHGRARWQKGRDRAGVDPYVELTGRAAEAVEHEATAEDLGAHASA